MEVHLSGTPDEIKQMFATGELPQQVIAVDDVELRRTKTIAWELYQNRISITAAGHPALALENALRNTYHDAPWVSSEGTTRWIDNAMASVYRDWSRGDFNSIFIGYPKLERLLTGFAVRVEEANTKLFVEAAKTTEEPIVVACFSTHRDAQIFCSTLKGFGVLYDKNSAVEAQSSFVQHLNALHISGHIREHILHLEAYS